MSTPDIAVRITGQDNASATLLAFQANVARTSTAVNASARQIVLGMDAAGAAALNGGRALGQVSEGNQVFAERLALIGKPTTETASSLQKLAAAFSFTAHEGEASGLKLGALTRPLLRLTEEATGLGALVPHLGLAFGEFAGVALAPLLAVAGAVAAIGFAVEKLTEDEREAVKHLQELHAEADKLRQQRGGEAAPLIAGRADLLVRQAAIQQELAQLADLERISPLSGEAQRRRDALEAELDQNRKDIATFETQITAIHTEAVDKRDKASEEAHQKELGRLKAVHDATAAAETFATQTHERVAELTGQASNQAAVQLQDFLLKYAKVVKDLNETQRAEANLIIADFERRIAGHESAAVVESFATQTHERVAALAGQVTDQAATQLQEFLAKYAKVVKDLNETQRAEANLIIADFERRISGIESRLPTQLNQGDRNQVMRDTQREGATPEQEHDLITAAGKGGDVMARAGVRTGFEGTAKQLTSLQKALKSVATEGVKPLADAFTQMFAALGAGDNVFGAFLGSLKKALSQELEAEGRAHILKGLAKAAEGLWPPNPVAIAAGLKEAALGALMATGGGLVGGGGAVTSGGGVPTSSPVQQTAQDIAKGKQTVTIEMPAAIAALPGAYEWITDLVNGAQNAGHVIVVVH
ncbi:MAG TPA: hypothetical protein VJN95_08710 [Gemmatimonadales bacterium]|nr:hypothetical protein [Gemmatimonadales bacterium]